jgi:GH15 family glucan-1,4-alpha-glucosidase
MDAAYPFNKYAAPISYASWRHLRDLVNWVANNRSREHEGVWEVRSGWRHFVYSKFMCWVALDRGLRLTDAPLVSVQGSRGWSGQGAMCAL